MEVLSESTAAEDLGPKLREYQTIETLEEYLTVDSGKRWAQVLRRTDEGWLLSTPVSSGAVELRSIGLLLDLDELYTTCGIT